MTLERINETNRARAELYETLALLTDRLNYAKRFDNAVERQVANIKEVKRTRPEAFAAGVAGVAAVSGAIAWFVTKQIIKRLK